jgi:hypothetical protein
MNGMTLIIGTIERLEAKRDAGTITMSEEATMIKLIEKVEKLIS